MISTPATVGHEPLPRERHEELALAAQTGDTAAADTLYRGFIPYLRQIAGTFDRSLDYDEALAVASAAFVEAVHAYEHRDRGSLIGLVRIKALEALTDAAAQSGGSAEASILVSISPRSRKRFFSILRKAGGDVEEATALAPAYHMSRDTFLSIARSVVDAVELIDDIDENARAFVMTAPGPSTEDAVEEVLLLDHAWTAVDDTESKVCEMAYGFSDYRPLSDAEVGDRLGHTRRQAQRIRYRALDKMRASLGLDPQTDSRKE